MPDGRSTRRDIPPLQQSLACLEDEVLGRMNRLSGIRGDTFLPCIRGPCSFPFAPCADGYTCSTGCLWWTGTAELSPQTPSYFALLPFGNAFVGCFQVYEDLRAITLSLDDVAEFTGMLDEDMDDVGY